MEKKLEVKEPLINCFTDYGIVFSIISDDLMPWVFNNFIQIRYSKNWDILTFDNHHMLLSHCPGLSFRTIPYNFVDHILHLDLKKLITEAIDASQYVFMYVDRFYIPGISEYQKKHFLHEIFIYGYDLDKDIVYMADNLENGKFVMMECAFSVLEKAYPEYNQDFEFMTDIGLISKNHNITSKLNIEQVIDALERYLYSKITFDVRAEQECFFGIGFIEGYIIRLKQKINENQPIDIRIFHLLFEHKLLMEKRIMYLLDNNYIANDEIDLDKFSYLKKEYLVLRNLVVKYNISKKVSSFTKIIEQFEKLIFMEKSLLAELITILRKR